MTAACSLPDDETRQLSAIAAEMLRRESPVSAFRALRDAEVRPAYDEALWRRFVDMGWTAMAVPEDCGGLNFGYRGIGLLCEEMGRHLVASPYLATAALAPVLLSAAAEARQRELLAAIGAGATTVALALDEGRSFAPEATTARALVAGDGYRLTARKTLVADGSFAEHLLLLARIGDGADAPLALFHLAPGELPEAARRRVGVVDSREYAEIAVADLPLPPAALLAQGESAATLLERLIDVGAALVASEQLGIADAVFAATIEYLKVREQFGAAIGSFQALQHRAADLYCRIELLRSVVHDALAAIDARRHDASMAASHAKALAAECVTRACTEAIQLHGGIGVTDDLDIGLYYKRQLTLRQLFGSHSFHTDRFARQAGY